SAASSPSGRRRSTPTRGSAKRTRRFRTGRKPDAGTAARSRRIPTTLRRERARSAPRDRSPARPPRPAPKLLRLAISQRRQRPLLLVVRVERPGDPPVGGASLLVEAQPLGRRDQEVRRFVVR